MVEYRKDVNVTWRFTYVTFYIRQDEEIDENFASLFDFTFLDMCYFGVIHKIDAQYPFCRNASFNINTLLSSQDAIGTIANKLELYDEQTNKIKLDCFYWFFFLQHEIAARFPEERIIVDTINNAFIQFSELEFYEVKLCDFYNSFCIPNNALTYKEYETKVFAELSKRNTKK